MSSHASAPARTAEGSVAQLAKFFPAASPVRLPVRLSGNHAIEAFSEDVVIAYGTANEVLFACQHPLEFGDRVRLQNADSSLDVEATVVAVQHHNGEMAVAARFTQKISNWIVKL